MEHQTYREQIARAYADSLTSAPDPWRPGYHLTPMSGTLADPNGLCQTGSTYHIFYITNPLACRTAGRTPCVWGHYTTEDFVHYRREKTAIYPDDRRDRDGVYSGSALARDGKLYLYYTGNVRHAGDFDYIHAGREQNVLRVESTDGVHFSEKTLLMTNDDFPTDMTNHVRDPQIIVRDGQLYLLLGARTQEDVGCALVYHSEDGRSFRLVNRLNTDAPFGYMWECLDLAVVDGQPLLLCCPQGIARDPFRYQNAHQCGCFPLRGDFAASAQLGAFQPFDYGFDLYAARTLKTDDGRALLIAWMGMSEADYGRTPSADLGWDQVITMPRELHWKNGQLLQKPLPELDALRGPCTRQDGRTPARFHSRRCQLHVRPEAGQDVTIRLYEDAVLRFQAAEGLLTLEMGAVCGAGRDIRRMKLERLEQLALYLDSSVLEVFVNDGCASMTSRIFGLDDAIAIDAFAGTVAFYPMRAFSITDAREGGV